MSQSQESELEFHLRKVLASLVENQPANPLLFLCSYFTELVYGTNSLAMAYRQVRLSPPGSPTFMDNIVSAYAVMVKESGGDSDKVATKRLRPLLAMLCGSLPGEVTLKVMEHFCKSDDDFASFSQFTTSIEACIELERVQSSGSCESPDSVLARFVAKR